VHLLSLNFLQCVSYFCLSAWSAVIYIVITEFTVRTGTGGNGSQNGNRFSKGVVNRNEI